MIIDAKYMGNKSRFINHSTTPNIKAKIVHSGGDLHIAFYAMKNIQPGTELVFDYIGNNK